MTLPFPAIMFVTNYQQMLGKLAFFLFAEIYIGSFFLRDIPEVASAFTQFESIPISIQISGIAPWANLAGFVMALLVTLLSYMFKLHDKISDLFGIRRRFDLLNILIPLASMCGATLDAPRIQKMRASRDKTMQAIFYAYASSTRSPKIVDDHYVHQALTNWSWYWVAVEGTAVWAIFFAASSFLQAHGSAVLFAWLSIFYFLVATLLYASAERHIKPQLDAIVANTTAHNEVRAHINAL